MITLKFHGFRLYVWWRWFWCKPNYVFIDRARRELFGIACMGAGLFGLHANVFFGREIDLWYYLEKP